MNAAVPRVLVVAGHDQSGAGLDADRDALQAVGVSAVGIATAQTDQDDKGVRSVGARDPDVWLREAIAALGEPVHALKFGLLPGVVHVRRAAQLVLHVRRGRDELPIVLDPVIAASSGTRFLAREAVEAMRGELVGLDLVITPNLDEAGELALVPPASLRHDMAARLDVARLLLGLGARAVVLKGGHGDEEPVRDLVLERNARPVWLEHARIPGGTLRGSGCRFASHLAGGLASGASLVDAARAAGNFVAACIQARVAR